MDYKERNQLMKRIKDLDLLFFKDFETVLIGRGICFRVEDFNGDAIEGYYDTENNDLQVYFEHGVTMNEIILDNVTEAIYNTIEDFLEQNKITQYPERYMPADKEAFDDLKEVMVNHELWGDQFLEYTFDLLESRYGFDGALERFRDIVLYKECEEE